MNDPKRRPWATELPVFGVLWALFLLAGRHALFQDPGALWHVAAGQRMRGGAGALQRDPFGFESFGTPWIAMQWLAEKGMAALYEAHQHFDGIWMLASGILALTYALVWRSIVQRGGSLGLATLLTFLAMGAGAHHFIARPHLVTLLFTAVLTATLLAWEERRDASRLGLLVPCFLFWVNAHGGVLAGLCSAVLVIGVGSFRAFRDERTRALGSLLFVPVLLGTSLVNPYGVALPRTWLTLSSSPVLPRLIEEHAPPDFHMVGHWLMLGLGLGYVASLLTVPRRRLEASHFLPLVWFVLSLRSVRHIPLFALVTVMTWPVLVQRSDRLQTVLSKSAVLRFGTEARLRFAWTLSLVPAVVTAASLLMPTLPAGFVGPPSSVAPMDTLPALHAAAGKLPKASGVLNEMIHGGFVMLYVPELRVYIDDRWEVHGDDKLLRYVHDSERAPDRLIERARRLGIRLALAPRGSPLETALEASQDFRRTFRGESATLYEWGGDRELSGME